MLTSEQVKAIETIAAQNRKRWERPNISATLRDHLDATLPQRGDAGTK
jgi:hypothetical protein